jgi:lysophospholipase L1-like esterase
MIKILLAFFICTTIYGLIVAYPIYRAMKLATQLVSETKPYEQHPENPTQNFLVAGDSTAAGVGSVDNKLSTAGRLGAQFPDAEITNLGVSGDRLQDLLKTLKNLSNQRFDLILLQIGANDITHFTPYKKIDNCDEQKNDSINLW